MDPNIHLAQFDIEQYQEIFKNIDISCKEIRQTMFDKLKTCYIVVTIELIKQLKLPLPIDIMFGKLNKLNLFYENLLDLYNFIYNISLGEQDKVSIMDKIQILTDDKHFWEELNLNVGYIKYNFEDKIKFLRSLTKKYNYIFVSVRYIDNIRYFMKRLKDCYVDSVVPLSEKLEKKVAIYNKTLNPSIIISINGILGSIMTSLKYYVIIRDYDSYINQELLENYISIGHLEYRNHLVNMYHEIAALKSQYERGVKIDQELQQYILDNIYEYTTDPSHGQLI